MADPYLGEVRIFSFGFAPRGWAMCNGQVLAINQNQALFSLLGTTYGGNGVLTFALPNLQGRYPMHVGNGHVQGERAGEANHTLTMNEMPTHMHAVNASASAGDAAIPAATTVLASPLNQTYRPADALAPLHGGTIANVGGSQPHTNEQPYLVLNFCIALVGIFPSRN
jgi:microcystin-dependent protein